jgi:hypothetical protein
MSTTHSAGKIGCVENVSIEKNICPFNFFFFNDKQAKEKMTINHLRETVIFISMKKNEKKKK